MTNLNQFRLFPLLPFELRAKIWGHVLTQPRTITLSYKRIVLDGDRQFSEIFSSPTPTHSLLHVSRESRDETLHISSYVPRFKTARLDRSIYTNFEYDTIRCEAWILQYIGQEEMADLKTMTLEVKDATYYSHFYLETVKRMSKVEELVLLVDDGEIYSWNRGGGSFVEGLLIDFHAEKVSNSGWKCPKIRICRLTDGEELGVIEDGILVAPLQGC